MWQVTLRSCIMEFSINGLQSTFTFYLFVGGRILRRLSMSRSSCLVKEVVFMLKTGACIIDCVVQGVQFDFDSPLTLRLEFARSNTKTTSTKPQQQQQQQPVAATSRSTAGCLHHPVSAASVASLTGCKYRRYYP